MPYVWNTAPRVSLSTFIRRAAEGWDSYGTFAKNEVSLALRASVQEVICVWNSHLSDLAAIWVHMYCRAWTSILQLSTYTVISILNLFGVANSVGWITRYQKKWEQGWKSKTNMQQKFFWALRRLQSSQIFMFRQNKHLATKYYWILTMQYIYMSMQSKREEFRRERECVILVENKPRKSLLNSGTYHIVK